MRWRRTAELNPAHHSQSTQRIMEMEAQAPGLWGTMQRQRRAVEMSSDLRWSPERWNNRKVLAVALRQRSVFAQRLAEDVYETVALRSGPAQTDPEFQLDGIDLLLHRERRQRANRRRRIGGEAGAEYLHKIVFISSRIAPAERHIDSLGQSGRTERQNDVSKERRTQCGRCRLTGGDDLAPSLFEPHPEIADWLHHVPAVNKKHSNRVMTRHQRREQLNQSIEKPRCTRAHLADTVEVQVIAVPRLIDECITTSAGSEKGRQLGSVQIVDFEAVADWRIRRASPAMGRNQHDRHLSVAIRHPGRQGRQKVKGHAWSIAGSMTGEQPYRRSTLRFYPFTLSLSKGEQRLYRLPLKATTV